MKPLSVIVFGPQACGKSRNADRLRRHYGLTRVVDDWNGQDRVPPIGALILTNADHFGVAGRSIRAIPYKEAAAAAGCSDE